MNMFINFMFMFIALYPCIYMGYIPFANRLNRSAKRIAVESFIASVIYCLYGSIGVIGPYGDSFGSVVSLIFIAAALICYLKSINQNPHKPLFVFALLISIAATIGNLRHYIWQFVGEYLQYADLQTWQLLDISLRVILYPVVWLIIKYWLTPRLGRIDSDRMKGLWIVPAMFIVISIFFTMGDIYPALNDIKVFFSEAYLILFAAASFAVYILLLRILDDTTKHTHLESDIKQMNSQLQLQSEHYNMLRTHIDDTKRARHDLRQHLSAFKSYIETGETEKLAAYINEYSSSLPDDTEIIFCENYAVNSILRHYIGIARSEGVKVDVHTKLPENVGVNDSDLCIIFGNCLENAIEACRWIEDTEKFINISSKTIGSMLAVTIDNSFDGVIKQGNGVYLSRKRDGEGIGIASVKAVALKYGIEACFEVDGNVFRAEVMLRRNK